MRRRPIARSVAALVTVSFLAACGGGGGGGATPPSSGGGIGGSPSYYTCPSSDNTSSVGVGSPSGDESIARHVPSRADSQQEYAPELVSVFYRRAYASAEASAIAGRESSLGVQNVHTLDFPSIGESAHVMAVDPSRLQSVMAGLRTAPGVVSISRVALRRPLSVTTPYFPDNPYFDGFAVTVAPTPGATAPPATNNDPPYYERNDVPGEWDAHATKLEDAFAYSQSGNGSGVANADALGSASVVIAMIDTGQDTAHPELAGKIIRQRCYITNPEGMQSISNFTTDPQGHGTDTAGIAADALGTGIGFAGAGGNVSLFGYRVFPTPDSYTNCSPGSNSNDLTCEATTADIASAIDDAVGAGANVISLSLGGGACSGGVDPDPTEGAAIQNALSHDVIVVAASGNGGANSVLAPACDSGVIAVGATALDDGSPNGKGGGGNAGGTASKPVEYVASYSNYGASCSVRSTSCWGIVAPGGDPANDDDDDDLHWIENIWPSDADLYSNQDDGNCEGDYPTDTGTSDCRILIAGTSMATPHVAGAAALLLAVKPSLQSPSAMFAALCDYADDLSDPHQGCGRLNVYTSMAHAVGDPSPPTPVP